MKIKKSLLGQIIILLSLIFALSETYYFGNNMLPESLSELICDIIALCSTFTGLFIYFGSQRRFL